MRGLRRERRHGQALFPLWGCWQRQDAQFLPVRAIDQLRELTWRCDIPAICYGLRTDFRTRAFAASRRLLEVADSIEEIKICCNFCNDKAVFNLKHRGGVASAAGPVIDLGAEEKFLPACCKCYREQLELGSPRGELRP